MGPVGQSPGLPFPVPLQTAATVSNGSRYTIRGGSYGSRSTPSLRLLVFFPSTLLLHRYSTVSRTRARADEAILCSTAG